MVACWYSLCYKGKRICLIWRYRLCLDVSSLTHLNEDALLADDCFVSAVAFWVSSRLLDALSLTTMVVDYPDNNNNKAASLSRHTQTHKKERSLLVFFFCRHVKTPAIPLGCRCVLRVVVWRWLACAESNRTMLDSNWFIYLNIFAWLSVPTYWVLRLLSKIVTHIQMAPRRFVQTGQIDTTVVPTKK